ncbi:MAG: hypothetical protein GEV07_21665 [Streptosporangiales bacterium]|nr:hypothetical protein [Streptosporangiales bacterium]
MSAVPDVVIVGGMHQHGVDMPLFGDHRTDGRVGAVGEVQTLPQLTVPSPVVGGRRAGAADPDLDIVGFGGICQYLPPPDVAEAAHRSRYGLGATSCCGVRGGSTGRRHRDDAVRSTFVQTESNCECAGLPSRVLAGEQVVQQLGVTRSPICGNYEPIEVIAPEGCVLNPRHPAPVVGRSSHTITGTPTSPSSVVGMGRALPASCSRSVWAAGAADRDRMDPIASSRAAPGWSDALSFSPTVSSRRSSTGCSSPCLDCSVAARAHRVSCCLNDREKTSFV